MKKFARGGSTDRAKARMDRRMADIEKDYREALAKGRSEKVARAKRDQRIADARDDYAKRTGADRTETRAAERAAEARLRAARRAIDKDIKPLNVTREGSKPVATPKVAISEVETPKVGASSGRQTSTGRQTFSQAFAAARRSGAKTFTWNGKSYTTEMRGERRSSTPARRSSRGSGDTPTVRTPVRATDKPGLSSTQYTRALRTGVIPSNASAEDRRNLHATFRSLQLAKYSGPSSPASADSKPRQGYVAGSSKPAQARGAAKGGKVKKYAKGGAVKKSINGIAKRGLTRAARKK